MQRKRKQRPVKKPNRSRRRATKKPVAKKSAKSGLIAGTVVALCEIVGAITWWGLKRLIRNPFSGFLVLSVILVAWIWLSLPDVGWLERIDRGTEFYVEKQGRELTVIDAVTNLQISLKNIPDHLEQAVIASEDRDFYQHFGISITGLSRAALGCLRYAVKLELRCSAGGGSTITQQLAKLMFLYQERTLWRKLKELVLAIKLESHYDKKEILRIYLNRVALGPRVYGVEQAARTYFHKHAWELNLYESAIIVGAITRPSVNSFAVNKTRAYGHGEKVLEAMIQAGYLTVEDKFRAMEEGYSMGGTPWLRIYHGSFWHWIKEEVRRRIHGGDGMFVVITTLNSEMQVYAERELNKAVNDAAGRGVQQGALVAMAPDGAVYAMVGGVRNKARGWNRATQAERQPGSIIKPLIYLAALEKGWNLDEPVDDMPLRCDGWEPSNHDGKYLGPLSLTEALAQSRNTTAVRLSIWTGSEKLNRLFHRFGLDIQINDACKEALGSTEISLINATMAYSVFANGGYPVRPYGVSAIRNEQGHFIYQHAVRNYRRIVHPAFVKEIDNMLRAAVVSGTGRNALLRDFHVVGKTGTTPRNRDAWFIGYSDSLVTGVWMGNDKPSPMKDVSGSTFPAQVFRRFMRVAHRNLSFIN